MKILCINQFFWPDLAPTSQMLSDVVRRLHAEGHQVTVLCGAAVYAHEDPSNPMPPGTRVLRVPSIGFYRGPAMRLLTYLCFFLVAIWRGLLAQKQDVVLTMTTPPLISLIGTLLKQLKNSRHFIWEMDLYPEVAIDLGAISSTSLLAKLVGKFADAQRRRADGIICLGECMTDRLTSRGIDRAKIKIAHNWADGEIFFPRPSKPAVTLSCIYPGNFGLGHDLDTLKGALPYLHTDRRIRIRFVGGGARYLELRTLCQTLDYKNIEFRPYCTAPELARDEFPTANVGLVLQDPRCSGSIVPSKVYSLLAAGLPVLFVGPKSATPAQIIERFSCGWHIQSGDSAALVARLAWLADRPQDIRLAGQQARTAFLENFDRPLGTARITAILGAEPAHVAAHAAATA